MAHGRNKQDSPLDTANRNEKGGDEQQDWMVTAPCEHAKSQYGQQESFRANGDSPKEKRATSRKVRYMEDIAPRVAQSRFLRKNKKARERKNSEDEHQAAENPEVDAKAGDEEPENVDEKGIIRGEGDDIDAVPLSDGAPNAFRGAVVGRVEHADFVVPAWCMSVGEDDTAEDGDRHGKHE